MQAHADAYGPMVGRKYGRLTVTAIVRRAQFVKCRQERRLRNVVYCQCDCECGVKGILVNAQSLKRGSTRSCGCLLDEMNAARQARRIEREQEKKPTQRYKLAWMLGKRYGRLTVTEVLPHYRQENSGSWRTYCRCDCDCGTKNVIVSSVSLSSGNTRSCGCLRREVGKNNAKYAQSARTKRGKER